MSNSPPKAREFTINQKDYEDSFYLKKLEPVSKALIEKFNDDQLFSTKTIGQLVYQLILINDEILGRNAKNKPENKTKLPIKLFKDYSPNGSLYQIIEIIQSFKAEKSIQKLDFTNRDINLELFDTIEKNLVKNGTLKFPVVFINTDKNIEELNNIVIKHGGKIVKESKQATHIVKQNEVEPADANSNLEYLRTIEHKNKLSLVHFWYYPDSYDAWLPSSEVEGEDPEIDQHSGQWFITPRWLVDTDIFNEWMNEIDYELEENTNSESDSNATIPKSPTQKLTAAGTVPKKRGRKAKRKTILARQAAAAEALLQSNSNDQMNTDDSETTPNKKQKNDHVESNNTSESKEEEQQQQQQTPQPVQEQQPTQEQLLQQQAHQQQLLQQQLLQQQAQQAQQQQPTQQQSVQQQPTQQQPIQQQMLTPIQLQIQQVHNQMQQLSAQQKIQPTLAPQLQAQYLQLQQQLQQLLYIQQQQQQQQQQLGYPFGKPMPNIVSPNKPQPPTQPTGINGTNGNNNNNNLPTTRPRSSSKSGGLYNSQPISSAPSSTDSTSATAINPNINLIPVQPNGAPISPNQQTTTSTTTTNQNAAPTKNVGLQSSFTVPPPQCAWFKMENIHDVERNQLPEFFTNKSPSKTPEVYKEYRDFMINTYLQNPYQYLTLTAVRRNLVGDVCSILRVHSFLEHWGLINYFVNPDGGAYIPLLSNNNNNNSNNNNSNNNTNSSSSTIISTELLKSPTKESSATSQPSSSTTSSTSATTPTSTKSPASTTSTTLSKPSTSTTTKKEASKPFSTSLDLRQNLFSQPFRHFCNICNQDCTYSRHQLNPKPTEDGQTLQQQINLCNNCFEKHEFSRDIIKKEDFQKIELPEPSGLSQWTDQETLLLLEALDLYSDSWNDVADYVGTKTKEQCLLHFLQLPIEEPYLEDNITKSVSLQPSNDVNQITTNRSSLLDSNSSKSELNNPIISLISFLSTSVSSDVVAASVKAATQVLKEQNSKDMDTNDDVSENNDAENEQDDHFTNIQSASSAALAAASIKAKALSKVEEKEIQSLILNIINVQTKKLELKLKCYSDMEDSLDKERNQLEKARQSLFSERYSLLKAAHTNQLAHPISSYIVTPNKSNNNSNSSNSNNNNLNNNKNNININNDTNNNQVLNSDIEMASVPSTATIPTTTTNEPILNNFSSQN